MALSRYWPPVQTNAILRILPILIILKRYDISLIDNLAVDMKRMCILRLRRWSIGPRLGDGDAASCVTSAFP